MTTHTGNAPDVTRYQSSRPHATGAEAAPEWLTLGEAARYLGVAQSTVRKWADMGRIETFKTPGGHRRFRRGDLDVFMQGTSGETLPESPRGGPPLVLVVDDDAAVRAVIRECLVAEGFAVAEGANAQQGIDRINERIPDLMMLDVSMPGIDGWEMLRRVREKLDVEDLPVVIFSGKVELDELGNAPARGAQGYLRKPFDPLKLVAQAKALILAG
jgi:excisionase family DNA binding protein